MGKVGLSGMLGGLLLLGNACGGATDEHRSQTGGNSGGAGSGATSGVSGADSVGGAKDASGGVGAPGGVDESGGVGASGSVDESGGAPPLGSGGSLVSAGSGGSATGGDDTAGAGGNSVSDDTCLITRVQYPGSDSEQRSHRRVSFNAQTRVLTIENSNPFLRLHNYRLRRLLNQEGQIVAEAIEPPTDPMRTDFLRDAAGNVVELTRKSTTDFDFSVTPPPPYYSRGRYTHTYDAAGALTNTSPYGSVTNIHFAEDEQGRCTTIESVNQGESPTWVQRRTYDGDRLVAADITKGSGSAATIEFQYDGQGRLVGYEQDGGFHGVIQPVDGVLDRTASYEYADDGSLSVTTFSSLSDIPGSDEPELWQLSPRCAELWATLPRPTGARCRFPVADFDNLYALDACLVPSVFDFSQ